MKMILLMVVFITGKGYIKINEGKLCIGQGLRRFQLQRFLYLQDTLPSVLINDNMQSIVNQGRPLSFSVQSFFMITET